MLWGDFLRFILKDANSETLDSNLLEGMTFLLCSFPDASDESINFLQRIDGLYGKLMIRNIPILASLPLNPEELNKLQKEYGFGLKLLSDPQNEMIDTNTPIIRLFGKDGVTSRSTTDVDGIYEWVKSSLK